MASIVTTENQIQGMQSDHMPSVALNSSVNQYSNFITGILMMNTSSMCSSISELSLLYFLLSFFVEHSSQLQSNVVKKDEKVS